jgi:hypothetical protein
MIKMARMQTFLRAMAGISMMLLLSACAQTPLVDHGRTDPPVTHKPEKVAVIVALPDQLMREAVEIDYAEVLRKQGIPAVAASKLPGLAGGIRGEIDTDKVGAILRKDGADGVIVSFYTGGGRSGSYVRSGYYAEYEGTGVAYGWAQPYFVDVYTIQHGEDIQDFTITTYVETTYSDLETEQSVWRIVTETKDVEHTDTAVDIAHKAATQMAEAGLK